MTTPRKKTLILSPHLADICRCLHFHKARPQLYKVLSCKRVGTTSERKAFWQLTIEDLGI